MNTRLALFMNWTPKCMNSESYSCRARREEKNPAIGNNSCMWHDLGVGRSPCAVRSGQGAGDQTAEIQGRSGACAVVDRTAAFYVSFVMS
jgi:hypothetical protein